MPSRSTAHLNFSLRSVCLQIHWFSIVNSCVTVLLLTGFLATILMRVLKNDFIKYAQDDEEGGCMLLRTAHGDEGG